MRESRLSILSKHGPSGETSSFRANFFQLDPARANNSVSSHDGKGEAGGSAGGVRESIGRFYAHVLLIDKFTFVTKLTGPYPVIALRTCSGMACKLMCCPCWSKRGGSWNTVALAAYMWTADAFGHI